MNSSRARHPWRRHDRRDCSSEAGDRSCANFGLRYGPAPNARALGCLQHVAGLTCQVGSTALRPLRDLFVDRRNLHAFPSADEKRSGFSGSRPRSLAERGHWYGSQTRTSRSVRPLGDRALLAARVERCHCLRYACICPAERELMASRDWWNSLLTWGRLSYLAGPALS